MIIKHCGLFEGIGGFSQAAKQVGGIVTTQYVDINPDAQLVYHHHFPEVPIHADIKNYHPKSGEFDLITCGFPCTGTSSAGKRQGLQHPDSALWREGLRCLIECRPRFCVIEQPEGVVRRGLRTILGGLRMAGYSYETEIVSARSLKSGQQRNRLFIISYPDKQRMLYQQTSWSEQMREMVQRQRVHSTWLSVERPSHGSDDGLSGELVRLSVPTNHPGRIRARYLAGRTLTPPQAAIALKRVLYLNSLSSVV